MSDHRFFAFGKNRMARLESMGEAIAALPREDYVWFDLCEPTRADLEALVGPLGVTPMTIEDCLDEDQIPKLEDFPSYTFILFNGYRYADRELTLLEFDFLIGKSFLVTVHGAPRELSARLDERIKADMANVKRGPEFLCHVVLDFIADQKFEVIEKLEEELDDAEEAIVEDLRRFRPQELLGLRRRLLTVRKSLVHEREVLVKICRKDSPFISEKSIYSYRDIYDHVVRFNETAEICREMISNLMDMYLSMLNHRMTREANLTNVVVKRLTLITTIFMPLTLLAGVFGMSEWTMMTGPDHWRIAYPAFFGGMAAIGAANWLVLRWIDRRPREPAAGLPTAGELEQEAGGGAAQPGSGA